jgi:hypothetical protein
MSVRTRRGDSRSLAADPAAVGPADQQLRGDDRPDAELAQQRGAGRVCLHQFHQLGIQLGHLAGQEMDPGGDRLHIAA